MKFTSEHNSQGQIWTAFPCDESPESDQMNHLGPKLALQK